MLIALIVCIVIVVRAAGFTGRNCPPFPRWLIAAGFLISGIVAIFGVRLAILAVYYSAEDTSSVAVGVWQWIGWAVVLFLLHLAVTKVYRQISGQKGLTPEELEALEERLRNQR